jgi:hypothetical protein
LGRAVGGDHDAVARLLPAVDALPQVGDGARCGAQRARAQFVLLRDGERLAPRHNRVAQQQACAMAHHPLERLDVLVGLQGRDVAALGA